MLFGEGPQIKNIAADLNKLFRQGSLLNQSGQTVEGDSTADQGTSDLLAAQDPVIQEISVGMSGEQSARYTVSGTPPLSLPNSLGKPLKAWSVDVLPYQEGSGDPSPDNVRPIYGTDKLTIYTDSKYGGLVDWNQQVKNGNFASKSEWVEYASTYNVEDNTATVIHQSGEYGFIYQPIQCIIGHKYFVSYEVQGNGGFYIYWDAKRIYGSETTPQGEWAYGSVIFTGANNGVNLSVRTDDSTIGDSWKLRNIQICDLTQIFGAGNEPSTVEEFRALFPLDYYAYNAGQQMTVDQVNGAQYSPAVLTLPQTVYTGTIGSEGGESRWGEVDLGTLTWDSASGGFYSSVISDALAGTSSTRYDHIMCEVYKPVNIASLAGLSNGQCSIDSGRHIQIKDNRFTTGEEVKTGLAGVKLIYQLATPSTLAVPSPPIPTPTGAATTWATAEDGTVDSMEVTYVGKA